METSKPKSGQHYLERKADPASRDFQNTFRRPLTSSLDQDENSSGLQGKLAPSHIYRQEIKPGTKHRTVHASRAVEPTRSTASADSHYDSRIHPTQNSYPLTASRKAKSCKPSQGDLNRLALQRSGRITLPLETKNLELLSSREPSTSHVNKHGGSAALLHASRSQPHSRDTLSYSRHDSQGNMKTEAFRPQRLTDDSNCIVEVVEEIVKPIRSSHGHIPGTQQRRSREFYGPSTRGSTWNARKIKS